MVAKSNSRGANRLESTQSDGSHDAKAGRMDSREVVAKCTKNKAKLNGNYQTRFHSDQMVLVVARWEARPPSGQRPSNEN